MSWNYRIVYHPPSKNIVSGREFNREEYLSIHEVYYNEKDQPYLMTKLGVMTGDEGIDSLKSLREMLEQRLEALNKPILNNKIEDNIFKEISKDKQNELSKSTKDKK